MSSFCNGVKKPAQPTKRWSESAEAVGRPTAVVLLSGDDAAANADVATLIKRLGFSGIDLGKLAENASFCSSHKPDPCGRIALAPDVIVSGSVKWSSDRTRLNVAVRA